MNFPINFFHYLAHPSNALIFNVRGVESICSENNIDCVKIIDNLSEIPLKFAPSRNELLKSHKDILGTENSFGFWFLDVEKVK